MTSKNLCKNTRDLVYGLNAEGQSLKETHSGSPSATVLDGVIDSQLKAHADMQVEYARQFGCGIRFTIGKGAVFSSCELATCPFYPGGPDSEA